MFVGFGDFQTFIFFLNILFFTKNNKNFTASCYVRNGAKYKEGPEIDELYGY